MIRVVENQDKAAWFTFDKHLPITELNEKVLRIGICKDEINENI